MSMISKKIADRKMQVLALLIALVACVGFGGGLFAFFTDNASIADGVEMRRQTATVRYIYADDCNNELLGFEGMDGKAVTRGEAGVARVESADADEAYTVQVEAYYDGANWQLRNDEGEWSTEPQPIASPKLSKTVSYAGQDVNERFVPDYTSVTVTAATDATTGADSMDSDLGNVADDKYRSTTESTDADGNLVVTIVYHAAFRTASAEVDYRYGETSRFVDPVSEKVVSDLRGHAVTRADAGAAESDAEDADTAYVVPIYGLQTVSEGIHQWDAAEWGGDTGWNAWQVLSPSMAIASPSVAIDVKIGEYQSNFAFGSRAAKDDVREVVFTPDMDRVNVAFATSGTPGADVRTDVYEDDVKIADALTARNILSKERSASADAAGDAIAIFDFSVLDGAVITVFYSPITSEEYVLETGNALLTHLNQLGAVSNVEFGLYTNYPQFVEAFKNKEGVAVAVDAAGNLTYTDGKVTGYKSRAALTSTKANSYNIQLFYDRDTGTAYVLTKERMIANPDCSGMFGSKGDFGDIDWYLGWNGNNNVSMSVRDIKFTSWNVDDGKTSWDIANGFGFDTVLVEDTSYMFSNCRGYYDGLRTLDLTGWVNGLPNAKDMSYMFYNSSLLGTVALNGGTFATGAGLTSVEKMFMDCAKLTGGPDGTALNLSGMNLTNVKSTASMFYHCSSLVNLDVGNWSTSGVTNMSNMFYGCQSLGDVDLTSWDVSHVTTMFRMFCMSANADENDRTAGGPSNYWYGPKTLNITGWNTASLTDAAQMFSGCERLSEVKGVENLNMANVTDMSYMFYDCDNLGALDLHHEECSNAWDVSKVTTMVCMFAATEPKSNSNTGITSLNLSGWDTASLTDVGVYDSSNTSGMFWGSNRLTSVDVSGWTNPKLTSIRGMFNGLTNLKTVNVTDFNTEGITDMAWLFNNCHALQSVDLSTWNTASVSNMSRMFASANSLSSIDLTGSFNTESVTDMSYMFYMYDYPNKALTELDLRNFNTAQVSNMYYMFWGQDKLKNIYATDDFRTESVTNSTDMFRGCAQLAGGYSLFAPYDKSGRPIYALDKTYAVVNTADVDGYFTEPRMLGDVPVTGVRITYGDNVELAYGKIKVATGKTIQLAAAVEPENATDQTVLWSSNYPNKASVDENGLVTCLGDGVDPTITVTTRDGRYTASVTIAPQYANTFYVQGVSLDKSSLDLDVGDIDTLTYTLKPEGSTTYGGGIKWSSSDPSVVTVDDGNITAVAPGTATVTFTASTKPYSTWNTRTYTASCTVHVYGTKDVTGVSLDKDEQALALSETGKLTALLQPTDAKKTELTWSSSDESVATVDENGNVTPVNVGTATIAVTTAEGHSASCEVTVTKYKASTVAVVDGTEYTTVSAAINAARTKTATVTLVKDASDTSTYTVTGKVTLDLNGHILAKTGSGAFFTVSSGGSLAVVGGNIVNNATNYTFVLNAGVTLTIGEGASVVNNRSNVIAVKGDATLNIAGGSVSHDKSINSSATISIDAANKTLTLNMTSGSLSNAADLNVISGGTTKNVRLNISGGTIIGNINATVVSGSSLIGGTFTVDQAKLVSAISEGYEAVSKGNGTWMVSKKAEAAKADEESEPAEEGGEMEADDAGQAGQTMASDGTGKGPGAAEDGDSKNSDSGKSGGESDEGSNSDGNAERAGENGEQVAQGGGETQSVQGGEGQAGSSDAGAAGDSSGSEGSDASGGTNAITTQSTGARSAALADAGFVGGNVAYASTSDERAAKGSQVIEDEANSLAKGSANSMNVWLLVAAVVATMVGIAVMGRKRAATHAGARSGVPGSEGGRDA